MTTPRSNKKPQGDCSGDVLGGYLISSRQALIWLLSVSMFFTAFVGWQNRLSFIDGNFHQGTVNKAFQVNAKRHGLTNPVKQISLIGERNSGTKWMWSHLHDCFNYAIPVEKKFARYKHWFQPNEPFRYPDSTLVIAEFRNPYDWLVAMHHVPHHSPAHAGVDWKTFVTKTWTTERIGLDLKLKGDEMCQHHFKYRDLISCVHKPEPWKPMDNRTSLDKPFYEMRNDGSGKPYDNIMEMRSDKIRNTLEIKDFEGVADLWMVQYEYMLSHGTKELLERITEWTGIEPKCKAFPPQERRHREMPEEFVQFVTDHLNWTAEAFIGYEPIRPISKTVNSKAFNSKTAKSREKFEKFEATFESNDDDDDDATETAMEGKTIPKKNAERKTTSTEKTKTEKTAKTKKVDTAKKAATSRNDKGVSKNAENKKTEISSSTEKKQSSATKAESKHKKE